MILAPLILASASPRRVELLEKLGLPFRVVPSGAPEVDTGAGPIELCSANAERKAREVAAREPAALVIGADTLVALRNRIYSKPRSTAEARQFLRELGGRTHEVVTAVCLTDGGEVETFYDVTRVRFKDLSETTIQEYIAAVHVLDKAGAYAIQEQGDLLVERIDGSLNNVIGLPTEKLAEALARHGYSPRMR